MTAPSQDPSSPPASFSPNASNPPAVVVPEKHHDHAHDQAQATHAVTDEAVQNHTTAAASNTNTNTTAQPAQASTAPGSRVLGITGPAGEAGLPPSRPSSMSTSQSSHQRRWSQAPPSRRGGGNAASSFADPQSRPTTAASRTHVPLAAAGFFRPMSSQRLQQQRGQRPTSFLGHGSSSLHEDASGDTHLNAQRQSIGSNPSVRRQLSLGLHHDYERPPPSRGTDITDRDLPDRTTANTTPTGAETVRSRGESTTPLQPPPPIPRSPDFNTTTQNDPSVARIPTPAKSPRSFRSSFLLPGRDSRPSHLGVQEGHEKLASAESSPRLKRKEVADTMVKQELGKNYEYFAGNTVFAWGGRLQNTRDQPINIATGLFVVVPSALFFAFSAPWLWNNVSPAIPIIFAYIFVISISSFIHGSASDPGILPRNMHPFPPSNPNDDPLNVGPPTTDWTLVASPIADNAAMEVPTKYCKSCNIWRPPRAHHCRMCDSCIETQDHHCVWLNNCIGRRNYRFFFVFVMSTTVAALYLIGASLAHILIWKSRNDASFGEAINKWRVPFAMFIIGLLGFPYPLSLGLYHLFLMGRGETTREYLNSHKFLKKDRHKPFDQGSIWKNWLVVLLRPRAPTYLHLKRGYEQGDQRFGERRGKRTAPRSEERQGGGMEMQDVGSTGFQGPASRQKREEPGQST